MVNPCRTISATRTRESRREKKAKKAAEQWDQIQPDEKKEREGKKKKEKRNPSTLPPRGSAQTMAGSALGLGTRVWRKKKQAMSHFARVRHSPKTCIDWEACALTHQERPL